MMLATTSKVLGYDVLDKSGASAGDLNDTMYAQPLMFIAGMAHAELMKQKHPTVFIKVKAVAGFKSWRTDSPVLPRGFLLRGGA